MHALMHFPVALASLSCNQGSGRWLTQATVSSHACLLFLFRRLCTSPHSGSLLTA
jgi:hypothetical protein